MSAQTRIRPHEQSAAVLFHHGECGLEWWTLFACGVVIVSLLCGGCVPTQLPDNCPDTTEWFDEA